MNKYQLDVRTFEEFESPFVLGIYSKGHHDTEKFYEEMIKLYATEFPETLANVNKSKIKHKYWRNVPQGRDGYIIVPCEKSRGSYPVTVYDFRDAVMGV